MSKDSFIFYTRYEDALLRLSPADRGEVLMACITYVARGENPVFESPVAEMLFSIIKQDIDADKKKYAARCEKNRENIRKRWNTNEYDRIRSNTKDTDNDKDNDNDKDKKENIKEKAPKHKYGTYAHVMLTDEELGRLNNDYGEEKTKKAIQVLDDYIEQSGRKYKNHNLPLRKWAFDEVDKQERKTKPAPTKFSNFGNRAYDFAAIERAIGG